MFKMWLRTQFHFRGSNRSLLINHQTDGHVTFVRPPYCHFTFYKKYCGNKSCILRQNLLPHIIWESWSGAGIALASKFTRRSCCYYWCRELGGHWNCLRRDRVHTRFCKNRSVISKLKMGTHTRWSHLLGMQSISQCLRVSQYTYIKLAG
jgi:hypothetical protein